MSTSRRVRVPQDPLTSPNARTPVLDLDSVFGGGPGVRPDLYVENPDGSVGPRLKIGSGGVHEDVPRVAFFDLGDGNVKNNKKVDTTISTVLFTLPVPAIAPHTASSNPEPTASHQPQDHRPLTPTHTAVAARDAESLPRTR